MKKQYYLFGLFAISLFFTFNISFLQRKDKTPKISFSEDSLISEKIELGETHVPMKRFLLQTPESTTSLAQKSKETKVTTGATVYKETKSKKHSNVLHFESGACGRKENVPHVFWETAEDVESESINHVAKWFCNNFKPNSSERISSVRNLLNILTQVFENNSIEHWLDRGTLLGSIRNESFIPWDVDADLGLTFDTFKNFVKIVMSSNFTFPCDDCALLLRVGKHSHVIPFKFINTTNGIYVDAFLYFRDDLNRSEKRLVTYWPLIEEHRWIVNYTTVFPLKKACQIENGFYWCPNNSIEYTSLWYGTNWTSPLVPKGWKS